MTSLNYLYVAAAAGLQPQRGLCSLSHQVDFQLRYRGVLVLLAGLLLTLGCGKEQASLFEHDHELPSNWPHDLSTAASMLRQASSQMNSASPASVTLATDVPATEAVMAKAELVEMIGWIPEVAAETDLTEEQWNLLTDACDATRVKLEKSKSYVATDKDHLNELVVQIERFQAMTATGEQPKEETH